VILLGSTLPHVLTSNINILIFAVLVV